MHRFHVVALSRMHTFGRALLAGWMNSAGFTGAAYHVTISTRRDGHNKFVTLHLHLPWTVTHIADYLMGERTCLRNQLFI
jgi:hypothetical protein